MGYKEVLPIWWSMFWRMITINFISNVILRIISAILEDKLGHADLTPILEDIIGSLIIIPIGFWALKEAIDKHGLQRPRESE